ncbi:MAG: flagellar hook-basal body complex protein FliE [Planctomycetota bacterium]|jgi:flagellar hook-basal body complex protein FliE
MVNGIGSGGGNSFARDAIKSAMERQAEVRRRLEGTTERLQPEAQTEIKADFSSTLSEGLSELNTQVKASDELLDGILTGRVADFHEVAAQVKQADLSLKFALAVRNKFIDAYREVMRMGV